MKSRKGLEMAVTTVILIILSLAVLTILVIFFNAQTGFLSRWFKTQNSQSNVDLVVSGCNSLVDSESFYSYCCDKKEITLGENKPAEKLSCDGAREKTWASGRIKELSCEGVSCE